MYVRRRLQDLRVQASHTVDSVAANDAKVCHVDRFLAMLVDQRHPVAALNVAGEHGGDMVQVTAIDLVDDHQVPGEHAL